MDSNNSSSVKVDVYEIITNRIIELLEQGTVPWKKPWTEAGVPMNAISKRPYRGINFWLLLSLDYERNLFLTWDQIKASGASVKKGEHGHIIAFWKVIKKEALSEGEATNQEKQKNVPLLRYYKVFNVAQCIDLPEGFIEPLVQVELKPIEECEAIIHTMPQCPVIKHKEQKAFYRITEDFINMPKKKSFRKSDDYYATFFHELIHSTGHEKRLNRSTIAEMAEFGSETYSIEELVAELGSAYLCSFAGILSGQINNNAAYIKGWLGKLRDDKRFIVRASAYAQRATDFILNVKETVQENEVEQSELLAED